MGRETLKDHCPFDAFNSISSPREAHSMLSQPPKYKATMLQDTSSKDKYPNRVVRASPRHRPPFKVGAVNPRKHQCKSEGKFQAEKNPSPRNEKLKIPAQVDCTYSYPCSHKRSSPSGKYLTEHCNHHQANDAWKPSFKHVDMESSISRIQAIFRGHIVRRSEPLRHLRIIGNIWQELKDVVKHAFEQGKLSKLCTSESQQLKYTEELMSLLLQLDSLQGVHPTVREIRKCVARDIVYFQGLVDEASECGNCKSSSTPSKECERMAISHIKFVESNLHIPFMKEDSKVQTCNIIEADLRQNTAMICDSEIERKVEDAFCGFQKAKDDYLDAEFGETGKGLDMDYVQENGRSDEGMEIANLHAFAQTAQRSQQEAFSHSTNVASTSCKVDEKEQHIKAVKNNPCNERRFDKEEILSLEQTSSQYNRKISSLLASEESSSRAIKRKMPIENYDSTATCPSTTTQYFVTSPRVTPYPPENGNGGDSTKVKGEERDTNISFEKEGKPIESLDVYATKMLCCSPRRDLVQVGGNNSMSDPFRDRTLLLELLEENFNLKAVIEEVLQWGKQQNCIINKLAGRIQALERDLLEQKHEETTNHCSIKLAAIGVVRGGDVHNNLLTYRSQEQSSDGCGRKWGGRERFYNLYDEEGLSYPESKE